MSVKPVGPPNAAAHTAGSVQTKPRPLVAPVAGQGIARLGPLRIETDLERWQRQWLDGLADATGPDWTVSAFREDREPRIGLFGKHKSGSTIKCTRPLRPDEDPKTSAIKLSQSFLEEVWRHDDIGDRGAAG